MNVLIIGNNSCNNRVYDYFAQKGMSPVIISDVHNLRSLKGEVGNFTVLTKQNEFYVDFVVITEQYNTLPVVFAGLLATSICSETASNLANTETYKASPKEPIVFLLDYVSPSPTSTTIWALKSAIKLANIKLDIFYIAKFIRTAGNGVEKLYTEARNAGVTFVKYKNNDDIKIDSDLSQEKLLISVSDGAVELELKTTFLFTDGDMDADENFSHLAKALNLIYAKNNFVSDMSNMHDHFGLDSFYLPPTSTSRRGVFHLSRELIAEQLDEGLDKIYTFAKSGFHETFPFGNATIDGDKCAFCYNCYRMCHHAALEADEDDNHMRCLEKACRGCGGCVSICPAKAIALEQNFADAVITDTADNDLVAKEVAIIYCENTGVTSATNFPTISIDDINKIDFIAVPCGGAIDKEFLAGTLNDYKRVMSAVCLDDACRHIDGNKRACAQIIQLSEMLESAGVSKKRLHVVQVSPAMPKVFEDELREFLHT